MRSFLTRATTSLLLLLSSAAFAGSSTVDLGGGGIPPSEKGAPNGVATLDSFGLVPLSELPGGGGGGVSSVSGTSPITVTNGTTNAVVAIPQATNTIDGYLSASDWVIFNGKQGALSFAAPLINTLGTVTCSAASAGSAGCLSAADWTTFNAKEPAIAAGTNLQYWRGDKTFQTLNTTAVPEGSNLYFTNARAQAAISGSAPVSVSSGVVSMHVADVAHDGYLSMSDWAIFNGKQNALGFTPEDVANKSTDGTLAANSDTLYPSQKAVKTYADTKQPALTPGSISSSTSGVSVGNGGAATVGPNVTVDIATADASHDGLLSQSNWSTFNSKEPAISAGTTAQYWRGDKSFQTLDTSVVPENTNLYFTNTRADARINAQKGVALGIASLDGGGKVPLAQLPNSLMEFQGQWDAATNTPTLANGTGDPGDVYRANVAGTVDFGAGPLTFVVGDWAMYDGTIWQLAHAGADHVLSVNGFGGIVSLSTADIPELTNLYFTDARAIHAPLSGFSSAPGVVTFADDIISGMQKLDGNQIAGLAASMKYLGDWSGVTNYLANDVVTYQGVGYVCIANNHAATPDSAPLYWQQVGFPVLDAVTNGVTSSAPTQNAVFQAIAAAAGAQWHTGGNAGTGGGGVMGTTDAQQWTTIANGIYVDSYGIDGSVTSIQNVTPVDSTSFSQKRNQVNLNPAASTTGANFWNQNNFVGYSGAFDYAGSIQSTQGGVDNGSSGTVNYISSSENSVSLHGGGTTNLVKGVDMNAGISGATVGYWAGVGSYMNMDSGAHGTGRLFEAGIGVTDSTTTGWDLFGGNLNLSGTTSNSNNAQVLGGSVNLFNTAHSDQVVLLNTSTDLQNSATVGGITGLNLNIHTENGSAVSGNIYGGNETVSISDASTNNGVTGNNVNVQFQGTSVSNGSTGESIGISMQDTASVNNLTGVNVNVQGSSGSTTTGWTTGNFTGSLRDTAHTDNYNGVYVGDTLQDNTTVTNFSPFTVNAQVQNSATVTNGVNLINATLSSSTPLQGATGLNININGANVADATQKYAVNAQGGLFQVGYNFSVPPSATFLGVNQFSNQITVDSGSPISSLGFINGFGPSLAMHDDWTADFTGIHLGLVPMNILVQGGIDAGKTLDAYSGILSGFNDVLGAGTINQAINYRAAGVIPGGGSVTTGTEIGYQAMFTMCGTSSGNCWAFRDDSSGENYFGKIAIGTGSKKVANSDTALEIGNSKGFVNGRGDTTTRLALAAVAGMQFFDTTLNQLFWYDGTSWILATGTGGGVVTAVTASAPLASSGGTAPNITITQADTSTDGYLSSTDWNTFNSKEPAITAGTSAQYFRGDKTFQTLDTSVVPENTNLYYTSARFAADLATKSTSDLAEGSNLYYTAARFNAAFAGKTTDDLTEGATNLYFLNSRARSAISATAPVAYNSGTGVVSMPQSDATHDGYLSQTDWTTFNGKQAAGNYLTALTGDATASGPGSAALTLATVNGSPGSFGSASQSLSATVNGKGLVTALSAQSIQIAESQVTNLATDLAAKQDAKWSVVNGGNAAYSIVAADRFVRSGTALTANRTYTLPACAGGNVGEVHDIKNLPSQTFNVILAGNGGDTIDGAASLTLLPGDSSSVICGAAGAWDIR